ncbi:MAG: Gfo/Idh/MocA family oxidoreductase, partial [Candidatus Latescibacteria bacterium]|nr:Gfo/Idh/MocA family oxidoreductase [Candidatus Latescibacterota bacterium]
VLHSTGDFLELPANRRFTQMRAAFEMVEADFCTVVIPPAVHREAVLLAAERGMPVLSEKPIADTWEACLDIYRAVHRAGVKMQVVQNYRFTPRILTLKGAIDDGRIGRLNYLVGRFAADYRTRGAWGAFRHDMSHSLLVEGSIHHFDQLRNLSGADCQTVSGWEWNPGHPSFDGECCGLFVLRMTKGVLAQYEGNCLEAGWQNSWHQEYYRAEGEQGAVVVDRDGVVRLYEHTPGQGLRTTELPLVQQQYDGHNAMIAQFLDWLDGGPTPPTVIDDNIKSAALLFGAIEASCVGTVVDVEEMMRRGIG